MCATYFRIAFCIFSSDSRRVGNGPSGVNAAIVSLSQALQSFIDSLTLLRSFFLLLRAGLTSDPSPLASWIFSLTLVKASMRHLRWVLASFGGSLFTSFLGQMLPPEPS